MRFPPRVSGRAGAGERKGGTSRITLWRKYAWQGGAQSVEGAGSEGQKETGTEVGLRSKHAWGWQGLNLGQPVRLGCRP